MRTVLLIIQIVAIACMAVVLALAIYWPFKGTEGMEAMFAEWGVPFTNLTFSFLPLPIFFVEEGARDLRKRLKKKQSQNNINQ